jgi:predicted HicB family RNase H-like nuclease
LRCCMTDKDLLQPAERLSSDAETWADLSNALFDPNDGLLARAFHTREERAAFVQSDEYRRIRKLIEDAMARTGVVDGAAPAKSGRFVVRLPRSLHAALEREANREGVSLNQLVVAKLAVQLSEVVDGSPAPPRLSSYARRRRRAD